MGTAPDRDYVEPKEYFAQYEELPLYVRLFDFACLMVGGVFLAAMCFGALLLVTGCSNITVTQLADRCYANGGKASVSFAGDTGKVNCQ